MVRETGLEPVRDYHTPLKRARLPIPPLSRFRLEHLGLYQMNPGLSILFLKKIEFFLFFLLFPSAIVKKPFL